MVEKSMFDFAIIGAGASGVYAARLLREQAKQQGKNVRICWLKKAEGWAAVYQPAECISTTDEWFKLNSAQLM